MIPAPSPLSLTSRQRFLRACACQEVDRPPVWIMRQAGRYLPSYQAVRAKVGFMELCKTPELAAEVTVRAVEDLGVDAAIVFSDILLPCEAMGMELVFTDKGPHFPHPLASLSQIDSLRFARPEDDAPFLLDALAQIQRGLGPDLPVLGFAGAPFTLATYMTGGEGGSRGGAISALVHRQPDLVERLLDALVPVCIAWLQAQIQAGCAAVQLFDTWASLLAPKEYRRFALEPARRVFQGLAATVPTLYYVKGSGGILPELATSGATVISLDWMQDLHRSRTHLPKLAVQGNLDPLALMGSEEAIFQQVQEIHSPLPGHIFNLGHGILPGTPVSGARALVAAVQSLPSLGMGESLHGE